jgi:hypothetical protein
MMIQIDALKKLTIDQSFQISTLMKEKAELEQQIQSLKKSESFHKLDLSKKKRIFEELPTDRSVKF